MITAIFNKSKPINLVFTMLLLVLGFVIAQIKNGSLFGGEGVLWNLSELCVAVFSVFLVDFIVKKNSISDQNSFVVLFFSIFTCCFWNSSQTLYLMLSNLFVLLALRKIISLKTQTNTTQKIFDAGLWICIATLFHFWAVLFFIILYVGIAFYASNYYKNWLVPIVSAFIVFTIITGYEMAVNNEFYQFSNTTIVRGFHDISSSHDLAILSFFSIILLVALFFLSPSVRLKLQKNKLSYVILLFTLLIALMIIFLAPHKTVSMLLYGYFPLAALFATFFEKIKKSYIQSMVIYLMLFTALLFCFLSV